MGKYGGKTEGNSGWVNTDVAAEILGVSSRSVRNYILHRDLVARKETDGINEKYLVSVDSLHALRERWKEQGKMPRNRRASSRADAAGERTAELVRETATDMLRETIASLEAHIAASAELRAENGELRARLELAERVESTLRDELEGERLRHKEDVERERSERLAAHERVEQLTQEQARLEEEGARAQEEIRELREELESERSAGFWRRLFRS